MGAPALTRAAVEQVAIDSIEIGMRRRKTMGRIDALAKSIETHGLIHPIVLRNGCELVAGGRRLEACRRLGWKHIPARLVERMTDEELRAIELEENENRLSLTDFEGSKARLAEIRQAEADAKAEAEERETRFNLEQVSEKKRGPARTPGSRRDVASITGIPASSQKRVEDHVALAERYPFMQKKPWVQHQVLHAGAELEKLPEAERPKVAALLDQDAIPPKTAISVLETFAKKPVEERREILKLAQSDDEHDRGTALTRAAALPDEPDAGLLLLKDAVRVLDRATRACRIEALKGHLADLTKAAALLDAEFSKKRS